MRHQSGSDVSLQPQAAAWRTLTRRQLVRLRQTDEFHLYERFERGRLLPVRSTDGTRLHVEVFGPPDGYPIVLSHGICCRLEFWANQIAALSTDHRVIAFDHRGHGRSATPSRNGFGVERLGDDLAAVLAAALAPGERAVIAGHSLGGIAVQAWADRHPDDVDRRADAVALINTSPGSLCQNIGATLTGGWLPRPLGAIADLAAPTVLNVLGGTMVPHRVPLRSALWRPIATGWTTSAAARALLQELVLTMPAANRGKFIRALTRLQAGQFDASRITAPTVVIGSTSDCLTGFHAARHLASAVPNLIKFVELPGGHCSPIEHPAKVTAELGNLAGAVRKSA